MKDQQDNQLLPENNSGQKQSADNHSDLIETIEGQLERNPDVIQRLMERPVFRSLIVAETHNGPLPPARTLAGYEKVLPGAAERVMQMAEREQAHRHQMQVTQQKFEADLQTKAITEQLEINKTGQRYGFIISLVVLALAGVMAFTGHEVLALTLAGIDLVGLAAVFVVGRLAPGKQPAEAPSTDIEK